MNTRLGYTGTVINRTTESLSHFVTAPFDKGALMFPIISLSCQREGDRLRWRDSYKMGQHNRTVPLCFDILTGRQGCGCPVDTSAFLCRSTDRAGRRDRRPLRLPYCNGLVGDNLTCTVLDLPQYIIKQTSTRQRRISLCDVIAKFHRLRFHTAKPYITEHRSPSPFLTSGTLLQLIFLLVFF